MDLQAVRDEIATLLPSTAYDFTPGQAELPCYVVGLPDAIEPNEGSYGLLQVRLPVWSLSSFAYTKEGEGQVLALAAALLPILQAVRSGATFRSLRVVNIDRVGDLTVGEAKYLAAATNLALLVNNT